MLNKQIRISRKGCYTDTRTCLLELADIRAVSFFSKGWHHQIPIFPLRQLVMKLSFFISRDLDAHCLPGKHDIRPPLKKNKRLLS